jgi:hypothetical protein
MIDIVIRKLKTGEEKTVSQLIKNIFMSHVAPDYSSKGIRNFLRYIKPENIKRQMKKNYVVLAAENKITHNIIGVIAVRDYCHISLFFVEGPYQKKRIGRKLLFAYIDFCRKNFCNINRLSVNAAPNSVRIYEKLGFWRIDSMQEENGILYVPMIMIL